MRLLVILLLLLTPAYVYAGGPKLEGYWVLEAVRTKAGPVPKDKLNEGGMSWEFKPKGALVMTVWRGTDRVVAKAKWKLVGNVLTTDENGVVNTMNVTVLESGKIEVAGTADSTVVMTFAKSKKKK